MFFFDLQNLTSFTWLLLINRYKNYDFLTLNNIEKDMRPVTSSCKGFFGPPKRSFKAKNTILSGLCA